MKFFKYKKDESGKVTHILLENKDEVLMFLSNKDIFWKHEFDSFTKMMLIEDKQTRERLVSHTMFHTPIVSLTRKLNYLYDESFGFDLLKDVEFINDMYNKDMLDFIEKYDDVFVNRVGGYCYFEAFDKDAYEELFNLELQDIFKSGKNTYSLHYDTTENKVLVLENDPTLDEWTMKHFDGRVPYIVNLRSVMATNEFEEILNKFIKNYSKKIFVYTTGLDYEQMIDYVNRAVNCGFEEFEWVFNGFERESEFREFLDSKNIKYKITQI
jgi:hypothetical protein